MTLIWVTLEVIDPSVLGMSHFQLVQSTSPGRHRMMLHLGCLRCVFDHLPGVLLHRVAGSQARHPSLCCGLGWYAKCMCLTEEACLIFLRLAEIEGGS
jgi:hypothetical protein